MKEFINKLIEKLEELKTYYAEDFSQGYSCEVDCVEKYKVKKIVNELAEEYINISTTNADRIRSMTDEELAEFLGGIDHTVDDCEFVVKIGDEWLHDSTADILDWLQSEVEGLTE